MADDEAARAAAGPGMTGGRLFQGLLVAGAGAGAGAGAVVEPPLPVAVPGSAVAGGVSLPGAGVAGVSMPVDVPPVVVTLLPRMPKYQTAANASSTMTAPMIHPVAAEAERCGLC